MSSSFSSFSEDRFRCRVQSALTSVSTILSTTRSPTFPASVPHSYQDKYALSEWLTRITIGSFFSILESLGVNEEAMNTMNQWVNEEKRSVTLRFSSCSRCSFDRKERRRIRSNTEWVTERISSFFHQTDSVRIETKVDEWHWKYEWKWEMSIEVKMDDGQEKNITLKGREGKMDVITCDDNPPFPSVSILPPIDCPLTWLIQRLIPSPSTSSFSSPTLHFSINRSSVSCRTPRRNEEIDSAFSFIHSLMSWCEEVKDYMEEKIFPIQLDFEERRESREGTKETYDMQAMNGEGVFVPILPLFEERERGRQEEGENKAGDGNEMKDEKTIGLLSYSSSSLVPSPSTSSSLPFRLLSLPSRTSPFPFTQSRGNGETIPFPFF